MRVISDCERLSLDVRGHACCLYAVTCISMSCNVLPPCLLPFLHAACLFLLREGGVGGGGGGGMKGQQLQSFVEELFPSLL